MEQYTIVKSFVMLMALVGAFSFFFHSGKAALSRHDGR